MPTAWATIQYVVLAASPVTGSITAWAAPAAGLTGRNSFGTAADTSAVPEGAPPELAWMLSVHGDGEPA